MGTVIDCNVANTMCNDCRTYVQPKLWVTSYTGDSVPLVLWRASHEHGIKLKCNLTTGCPTVGLFQMHYRNNAIGVAESLSWMSLAPEQ